MTLDQFSNLMKSYQQFTCDIQREIGDAALSRRNLAGFGFFCYLLFIFIQIWKVV